MFKDLIPGGGTGSGDKPPKDVTATKPQPTSLSFKLITTMTQHTQHVTPSQTLLALATGGKDGGVDWDHLVNNKEPKTGLSFALEMFKFAKKTFKPSGKEPSSMLIHALDTGIKAATEIEATAAKGTDISFHLPGADDKVVKEWQKVIQDSNQQITVLNSTVNNSSRTKVCIFYFAPLPLNIR